MNKLFLFLQRMFSKMVHYYQYAMQKAKPFINKEIPVAINIVEVLKKVINSPLADFVAALIPGEADKMILEYGRKLLPVALVNLKLAQGIAAGATNDEIIQKSIEQLRSLKLIDSSRYGKALLDIAAELSHGLTDGKLTLSELVVIIQGYYESQVKKPA